LRAKIESVGIRSINNVVDITNFVMLELGQPLHAFDADKLKGGITVRLARDGETFLALDGKTYSLTPQDLMIADAERAVAIAGVMGGEDTGVTGSTRNVLLESAYFLPTSVRRTARNLNLPSDSSYRFERGVDPMTIFPASSRAAQLMREIADGNPAKEIAAAGKVPADPPDVSLGYNKCNQVLGIEIPPKKVDEILERFGLSKATSTQPHEVPGRPARRSRVTGAICNAMSIWSKKSCALTAPKRSRARTAVGSLPLVLRIFHTIWNRPYGSDWRRVVWRKRAVRS
jgi:phenylalanyl-tRNA synthetase beta chain